MELLQQNKHVTFMFMLFMFFISVSEATNTSVTDDQQAANRIVIKRGFIPPEQTTVLIFNYLGDAHDLTVHCKSKDDDLGTRVVPFKLSYDFHFRPNFWRSTLFFCGLSSATYGSAYVEAYHGKRDWDRCWNECIWIAKPDGIYGFKQDPYDQDLFVGWSK